MDKKHRPQKSLANVSSTKNTKSGNKKTQEKSHIPQKSIANIDKKISISEFKTTQKATVPAKRSNTTQLEVVEKPPPKIEKPSNITKKPSSSKVEESNPTEKKVLVSKREKEEIRILNEKIIKLREENISLKKEFNSIEDFNKNLKVESEEFKKLKNNVKKEKDDMEVIAKKAQQELKLISQRNSELSKKVEELQDNIEIFKEESEIKDIEAQILLKEFDEYKGKKEAEIKKAYLDSGKDQLQIEKENAPKKQENTEKKSNSAKINELEGIIDDLSNQLIITTEDRNYAITYYEKEIEERNKILDELKNRTSVIPQKEDLISQLTEKLKQDENILETLQTQLAILSPMTEMSYELSNRKEVLERTIDDMGKENVQLKGTVPDDEDIEDLDEAFQISEQVMINSINETAEIKKKYKEMEKKVKDYEENQTMLLDKIEDLKSENKMLKEDTSLLQESSQNIKSIWVDYLTNKNIIQNIRRNEISSDIYLIDNEHYLLRNKIIKNMIPKQYLDTANMSNFDKILDIISYKKKTYKLIMNILNNEILTEDLGVNPNKVEDDKIGKVEGEEKKKVIYFYETTINSLFEFYSYLLKIEIHFCKLTSEQFLKISNQNYFNNFYNIIIKGASIINDIINLVKSNNFGIQNKSNVNELKNINDQLKKEINTFGKMEENSLYAYLINIFSYFINISCGFKKERIDIIVRDLDNDDKLKIVADSFFDVNKSFNDIIVKLDKNIFENFNFSQGNNIFDIKNNCFQDLLKRNINIETELSEQKNFYEKYKLLIEVFNKVYIIMKETLEKLESSKIEESKEVYDNDREVLPIYEWNKITDELYCDLEKKAKVTEELKQSRKSIEDEKNKFMELQRKYENLEKMKNENDSKLGELLVKLGKFSQLESTNEENASKIQKYQKTVEELQSAVNFCEEKQKKYKEKLEVLERREMGSKHMKKTIGVDLEKLKIYNGTGENAENIDGKKLFNTIFLLQKERKNLKNNLMKEKLANLIEDKDSYMNKYIQKDNKLSKKENEKEKILYQNIKDKVINLNKGYDKIRKKLCLPKVYDLSSKDYDYKKTKKQQEDEIENTRAQYMDDADSILFRILGEKTDSKFLKEIVNSNMNKRLETFADKKISVGNIQFNDVKVGEDKKMNEIFSSKNTLEIPVVINEVDYRQINNQFD